MKKVSAGLLMYRIREGVSEVLLVHPGGPMWAKKDAWGIPKGIAEDGEEDLLMAAKREFEEETGFKAVGNFTYLTRVQKADGSSLEVWMVEGDVDASALKSNTTEIEWPPRSGKKIEIPEVDRGQFFTIEEAKRKIHAYQIGIIEALEKSL